MHDGGGRLESVFGVLDYRAGDYVVVPKGTTHRWVPSGDGNRHLVIETVGAVRLPKRYQSSEGQLLEHAPYWERDFRRPTELMDVDDPTPHEVIVRVGERAASTRSITTRSMSSAGTATSIRTRSRSTTSSRSPGASTSHRRCTRPSSSTER